MKLKWVRKKGRCTELGQEKGVEKAANHGRFSPSALPALPAVLSFPLALAAAVGGLLTEREGRKADGF